MFCFPITGIRYFNLLPVPIRNLSLSSFIAVLRKWLILNPFYIMPLATEYLDLKADRSVGQFEVQLSNARYSL